MWRPPNVSACVDSWRGLQEGGWMAVHRNWSTHRGSHITLIYGQPLSHPVYGTYQLTISPEEARRLGRWLIRYSKPVWQERAESFLRHLIAAIRHTAKRMRDEFHEI